MPLNFLYPNISTKNVPPPELNADERWFLITRLFDDEPRVLFENNHVDKETLGDIQEDSMLCFSAVLMRRWVLRKLEVVVRRLWRLV